MAGLGKSLGDSLPEKDGFNERGKKKISL